MSVIFFRHLCHLYGFQVMKQKKRKKNNPYISMSQLFYLVGVAGFEPTNDGIKNRCLTTWRHPNRFKTGNTISDFSENCKHFFGKSQFFDKSKQEQIAYDCKVLYSANDYSHNTPAAWRQSILTNYLLFCGFDFTETLSDISILLFIVKVLSAESPVRITMHATSHITDRLGICTDLY